MYTFENLIEDVKKEAAALKVHATKEELGRLDFNELDVSNPYRCIYGQIAFECFSDRASELILACCHRYFKVENGEQNIHELVSTQKFYSMANGEKIDGVFNIESLRENRLNITEGHYSAIEAYILLPEAKNANLIAYLKSETETLDL